MSRVRVTEGRGRYYVELGGLSVACLQSRAAAEAYQAELSASLERASQPPKVIQSRLRLVSELCPACYGAGESYSAYDVDESSSYGCCSTCHGRGVL